MAHPRITIIVPNLDGGRFLERTICSVLDQPYGHIEFMVVDGESSDQSRATLDLYRDELAWIGRGSYTRSAEAINAALAESTGEVIGILPAGDLYLPEALADVAAWFAHEREVADTPVWLAGHCLRIGPADEDRGHLEATPPHSLGSYLMHDSGVLPQAGTFYHRALLETHGPFDARLHFAFGYDMGARLLHAGHWPRIARRVLAAEREHASLRRMDTTLACGREYIDAAMRHADALALSDRYGLWRNCEQRRRIYALAEAEAHTSTARRLLWQRLLHHPWWLADAAYRDALLSGASRHASPAPTPRMPAA